MTYNSASVLPLLQGQGTFIDGLRVTTRSGRVLESDGVVAQGGGGLRREECSRRHHREHHDHQRRRTRRPKRSEICV